LSKERAVGRRLPPEEDHQGAACGSNLEEKKRFCSWFARGEGVCFHWEEGNALPTMEREQRKRLPKC